MRALGRLLGVPLVLALGGGARADSLPAAAAASHPSDSSTPRARAARTHRRAPASVPARSRARDPSSSRAGVRDCHRYRGRRVCEGPRRVPDSLPGAAELATELGLGQPAVVQFLTAGPRPEWVAAVAGAVRDDLLFPVEGGNRWRGFGRFGRGRRRHTHKGLDIGAREGAPIRVVNDGLVVYSDNGVRGYGNLVVVVHADGTMTFYGHCLSTDVTAGQRVRRGDAIGRVGETGLARGTHLHFEWHRDGRPVDPSSRFAAVPAEFAAGSQPDVNVASRTTDPDP